MRILVMIALMATFCTCDETANNKDETIEKQERTVAGQETTTTPSLPGTSWLLVSIYKKGTTPEYLPAYLPYLFCKSGRWETQFVGYSSMGNYEIKGNKLVQKRDGLENFEEVFIIEWNPAGNYLELVGSDTVYRLHFNKNTDC